MEETIELKEKKTRTPKQIEAFKKAQEIRKESLKIKREKIQQIKDLKPQELLEEKQEIPDIPTPVFETPIKQEKKGKHKKIKKRYYIEEESSTSSSSSDEEVIVIPKPKRYPKEPKQKPIPETKEIIYRFI